eukprot:COSAG06_NODE_1303_length_9931_cov_69.878255_4_plen_435_part_00
MWRCVDEPAGWVDSDGDTCADYDHDLCDRADEWNVEGVSAADVCCQCGAGSVPTRDRSANEPERYSRYLKGTWVAPTSGPVLLRLILNCAVVFWADAEAEGCHNTDEVYFCVPTSDGTNNGACTSELRLSVAPDAYFNDDSSATAATKPVSGSSERTDTIIVSRADIEAQAAAVWEAQMDGKHLNDPIDSHAPTLDEMLVSGTPANALLTSLFTAQQQPHVVYPLSFWLDASNGGHRRMQMGSDRLHVTIDTHAPTPTEASHALRLVVNKTGGTVAPPVEPHGIGSCDLTPRTQAVNNECCDEPSEDCSSGRPATCNIGCANVVLPFFEDCSTALGKRASDFHGVVVLCHAALAGKGRRLSAAETNATEECEATTYEVERLKVLLAEQATALKQKDAALGEKDKLLTAQARELGEATVELKRHDNCNCSCVRTQ